MVELALVWGVFGIGAAIYWRAVRRARDASPPLPDLDRLLTIRYDATVGIGGWGTGNAYSSEVLLDARHLVLALDDRHRAVLERARVRALALHGVFGYVVEHDGEQRLTFGLRRPDGERFAEQARRLGWTLTDVGNSPPPLG